jgi:hypothetical protein
MNLFFDQTGFRFYRAGGAAVASSALQRGEGAEIASQPRWGCANSEIVIEIAFMRLPCSKIPFRT